MIDYAGIMRRVWGSNRSVVLVYGLGDGQVLTGQLPSFALGTPGKAQACHFHLWPFGKGSAGAVFNMRLHGELFFHTTSGASRWKYIRFGDLACTLGTTTGTSNELVATSENYCKLVSWTPSQEYTDFCSAKGLPAAKASVSNINVADAAAGQAWISLWVPTPFSAVYVEQGTLASGSATEMNALAVESV